MTQISSHEGEAAILARIRESNYPLRQESAHGEPRPRSSFTRSCAACGACFLGLAAGKTGKRGPWKAERWYCSVECAEGKS